MGKTSESNVYIKFIASKVEIDQMDEAVASGYGLSRADLCRQAIKRYLMMLDPKFDTDLGSALITGSKVAKSYHICMEGGLYRCDITHAICDCLTSDKDCRSCVVPIEHNQQLTKIKSKK